MGKKFSGRSTQPIGGNVLYGMNDEASFYVTLNFPTYLEMRLSLMVFV